MQLCDNYDDIHSFLSFGALGMVEPPAFCTGRSAIVTRNLRASRNNLSLCGVIAADMVSCGKPLSLTGRGCVTWVEIESRSYMFGAVRNEPDEFTRAFLSELRTRPDLFHVVIRSETDPGCDVTESPNLNILPQMRTRMFEAPSTRSSNKPQGHGEWEIIRSAADVLYGTVPMEGYLTALDRPGSSKCLFHFKKFPVKYFVILDTTPNRDVHHLATQVAWAALRARGLAGGAYDPEKYDEASYILHQQQKSERHAWMQAGHG